MYLGAKVSICRSSAPNVGTRCFARLLSPHVQGTRLFSMTQWLFKFDMIHSITSVADFKFCKFVFGIYGHDWTVNMFC